MLGVIIYDVVSLGFEVFLVVGVDFVIFVVGLFVNGVFYGLIEGG